MRRVADIGARPPTPSESSAPPSSASSTGGRDPSAYDPTILSANVPGLASASLVWELFQQVVTAAKCRPADFEMVGSTDETRLAKRFTFQCKGTQEVAAQRAKEVAHSLWLQDGKYQQLSIRSPTGAEIPMYFSLDTAVAYLVRKRATNRVADALRQVGALVGLYVAARDGVVAHSWLSWAEVRFIASGMDEEVWWNDDAIKKGGVDTAAAREAYASLCQGVAGPQRR